jgi:Uma2 family endonuclease
MVLQRQIVTAEQFDEFLAQPENAGKDFELIAGEIVEVPSNTRSSEVAITIATHFKMHLIQNNIQGFVTGEAGLYQVGAERYAPDVAFKRTPTTSEFIDPNPPELAIEVVSPSDDLRLLSVKISNYLAAGITVWVAYPEDKLVVVHIPGKGATILTVDDTLTFDGLPDFALPIKSVF